MTKGFFDLNKKEIKYELVQGGNVPGGHYIIKNKDKKPFITPMKECNSIELRHSDIVVDIGAYMGTYSIRCARFPVKQVIAYEPTRETFEILNLTKLPNLKNINAAIVGDNKKEVELYISKGIGVTNSTIPSKAKPEKRTVIAKKYKDVIKNASIVKIDIEGGEYNIPLSELITKNLRAIIIDFHPIPKVNWINKAELIIKEILNNGFKTVIKPDWSNGWTRAGSWIRDIETYGEFKPMMEGKICCGCGKEINGSKKSICLNCDNLWSKKHKLTYDIIK